MNTPELKVGQRFLARFQGSQQVHEINITDSADGGNYVKFSLDGRTAMWAERSELESTMDVLHILEDGRPMSALPKRGLLKGTLVPISECR